MLHACRAMPLRAALAATVLLAQAPPAAAMNWEGHDDWMLDFPPGVEAFTSGEAQKPLPSPPCPVTWDMVKANPYEQIPLASHGCAPQPASGPDKPPPK